MPRPSCNNIALLILLKHLIHYRASNFQFHEDITLHEDTTFSKIQSFLNESSPELSNYEVHYNTWYKWFSSMLLHDSPKRESILLWISLVQPLFANQSNIKSLDDFYILYSNEPIVLHYQEIAKQRNNARKKNGNITESVSYTTDDQEKITQWVKELIESGRYKSPKNKHEDIKENKGSTPTNILSRGENINGIIDSVTSLEYGKKSATEQLQEDIKKGGLIPCKYNYLTNRGATYWLQLCNDPQYSVYRESVTFLMRRSSQIISDCGREFIACNPDIISIGCGDGQKDRIIIREIIRSNENSGNRESLYYYPFDISNRMLIEATSTIRGDEQVINHVKIKRVFADFEKIADFKPVFDYTPNPNFFLFLGNTLGNVQEEITLLNKINATMNFGDHLLLEIRNKKETLTPGGNNSNRLNLYTSALNILLGISKNLLSNVVYEEIDSISQIPETRTLGAFAKNVYIDGKNHERILTSCINYYDIGELKKKLTGSLLEFEIVNSYSTDLLSLILLKKKNKTYQRTNT